MKMTYKFYDTCSLLELLKFNRLAEEDNIIISSITLKELENIKTSNSKDFSIKADARHMLQYLTNNPSKYQVHIFNNEMLRPIEEKSLPITDDMRILATAINYDKNVHPDETVFVTNDLALYHIANLFFGADSIHQV